MFYNYLYFKVFFIKFSGFRLVGFGSGKLKLDLKKSGEKKTQAWVLSIRFHDQKFPPKTKLDPGPTCSGLT